MTSTPIAQFVRDGFLTVQTSLPPSFHDDVRQRAGVILDREGTGVYQLGET